MLILQILILNLPLLFVIVGFGQLFLLLTLLSVLQLFILRLVAALPMLLLICLNILLFVLSLRICMLYLLCRTLLFGFTPLPFFGSFLPIVIRTIRVRSRLLSGPLLLIAVMLGEVLGEIFGDSLLGDRVLQLVGFELLVNCGKVLLDGGFVSHIFQVLEYLE